MHIVFRTGFAIVSDFLSYVYVLRHRNGIEHKRYFKDKKRLNGTYPWESIDCIRWFCYIKNSNKL